MDPAPFSYAYVQSSSSFNGDSSLFTFTVTISVDSPIGTIMNIIPPTDLVFDDSKEFFCNMTQNMKIFSCNKMEDGLTEYIQMILYGDSNDQQNITNGTTISFEIGNIFNPESLKESNSFNITTFFYEDGGFARGASYQINSET